MNELIARRGQSVVTFKKNNKLNYIKSSEKLVFVTRNNLEKQHELRFFFFLSQPK